LKQFGKRDLRESGTPDKAETEAKEDEPRTVTPHYTAIRKKAEVIGRMQVA
jgi:hypothetical protein